MTGLPHIGEVLRVHAARTPMAPATGDGNRTLDFSQWNSRSCRLANGLIGLGCRKGDRVGFLARNGVEWMEFYAACAKAGLVAVPLLFRLAPPEIAHIIAHSGCKAVLSSAEFTPCLSDIRPETGLPENRSICFGAPVAGWLDYEELLGAASSLEPDVDVKPEDPWTLIYTSGTTGASKGALRSHGSYAAFFLINAVEFRLRPGPIGYFVLPVCHVNSLYHAFLMTFLGGVAIVADPGAFDPERLLRELAATRASFTSFVPTQCSRILGLAGSLKGKYQLDGLRTLLVSSAPTPVKTKRGLLAWFPQANLFEAYGSTEAGLVTMLHPEDQFRKPGSIGKEAVGTARIRLLDDDREDVADGEVGELFAKSAMLFDGYWNDPDRTRSAVHQGFFSAGDMARRDAEGFYHLVDRKDNLIITGGENVYPSEVEEVLAAHPGVADVAVVGLPDPDWGETVTAVIVARSQPAPTLAELREHCRGRIASFKTPKRVVAVSPGELPRTETGKVRHRALREAILSEPREVTP